MRSLIFSTLALLQLSAAAPALQKRAPSVTLTSATVVGSSLLGVDSFKGIPYAKPPVGPLRLRPAQPITANLGTIQATGTPRQCPQGRSPIDTSSFPPEFAALFQNIAGAAGEDCLTVTVQRPSSATEASKLPVVVYIYGGGFEYGGAQMYDGSELIRTSVVQGKPILFVGFNYRIGGFGFLAGSEILADGAANLGLLDQRLALQWVADNIVKFGGDPAKVTIWGESAGAWSVFDQLALYDGNNLYNGKPLFRGAVMNSGSILPADPVNAPKPQNYYDQVVSEAGCAGSSNTLACLRTVPYETYLAAANSLPGLLGYTSLALSYLPRPDGTILTASPEILARDGKFAAVPLIVGDQEDEGTLFSLTQSNITTTAQLEQYFSTIWFPNAPPSVVSGLVATYPSDPAAGSPFNTGPLNNIYPQYKRIAAMIGDLSFTLTRRVFLNLALAAKPNLPTWSYLATYAYGTPVLGTFHFSDFFVAFGLLPGIPSSSVQAYYLSFFNTLNPNTGTSFLLPNWPQWKNGKQLLRFGALTNSLTLDNFRTTSYNYIAGAINSLRL